MNCTVGLKILERLKAPEEASSEGSVRGELRSPQRENLGALINALEAALGFGDGLNRSHPKSIRVGGLQHNAKALPAILHPQGRAGKRAGKAQILRAARSLKKAVRLCRCQQIYHRFDTEQNRATQRLGK